MKNCYSKIMQYLNISFHLFTIIGTPLSIEFIILSKQSFEKFRIIFSSVTEKREKAFK